MEGSAIVAWTTMDFSETWHVYVYICVCVCIYIYIYKKMSVCMYHHFGQTCGWISLKLGMIGFDSTYNMG